MYLRSILAKSQVGEMITHQEGPFFEAQWAFSTIFCVYPSRLQRPDMAVESRDAALLTRRGAWVTRCEIVGTLHDHVSNASRPEAPPVRPRVRGWLCSSLSSAAPSLPSSLHKRVQDGDSSPSSFSESHEYYATTCHNTTAT